MMDVQSYDSKLKRESHKAKIKIQKSKSRKSPSNFRWWENYPRIGHYLRRWYQRHHGLETSVRERPGEESKLGPCSGGMATWSFAIYRSWKAVFKDFQNKLLIKPFQKSNFFVWEKKNVSNAKGRKISNKSSNHQQYPTISTKFQQNLPLFFIQRKKQGLQKFHHHPHPPGASGRHFFTGRWPLIRCSKISFPRWRVGWDFIRKKFLEKIQGSEWLVEIEIDGLIASSWVIVCYGLGFYGIYHHLSPPFWETMFGTFSKHRTSKSK